MRRLFTLLTYVIILFLIVSISTDASSNSIYCGFNADNDIKLNKGFNIYLNLKCDNNDFISALRMDITYDNKNLKFISATSNENSDSKIYTSLINENTVRIIYINNNGISIPSNFAQVCAIRFKPTTAPNNTPYNFSANILEAGNSKGEYLSINNHPTFTINSNSNNNDIIVGIGNTNNHAYNSSTTTSSSNSSSKNTKKSSKSESQKDNNNSNSDLSNDNVNNDISIGERKQLSSENGLTYFLYGVFGTFILVAIVFTAYRLGKKSS